MIKSLFLDSVEQMLHYATRYLIMFSENILVSRKRLHTIFRNQQLCILAMIAFIILDFKLLA